MFLLFLCIIINALVAIIFKYFEKFEVDVFQAIVINYYVCVITGSLILGEFPINAELFTKPWIPYALVLSLTFITTFTLMGITVQQFGVVIATIFQKMSLIAPAILGIVMYNEGASLVKVLGIVMAIVSIFVITKQKSTVADSTTDLSIKARNWLFPAVVLIGSCFIDSILYYVNINKIVDGGDIRFVIALFFFAGVIGTVILGFQLLAGKSKLTVKNLIAGIGLGVPNLFSIYLLILVLANGMPGSKVFPINNVGILAMSAILGYIILKEEMKITKIAGLALAIFSIILIANG